MTFSKNISLATAVIVFILGVAGLALAATVVNLGTADTFAVLAGSGITDTTPSVVSGDVGLSPTGGAAIGITAGEVTGTIYAVDAFGPIGSSNNPALLTSAKGALDTAYGVAAGQSPAGVNGGVVTSDLGSFNGGTLTPGVYKDNGAPNSLAITGTLTLNGQGDPNAVFIFQSGSTLTTASNSSIVLTNGTQACNVFWQVSSSATLGTGTSFKGNILAFSSITDNGGSTIEGRLLARGAAVTLNNTHVTKASCAGVPPTPSGTTGAHYYEQLPAINVTKIPSPLSLSSGAGKVTYTYTVTNIGAVAMNSVWVKDDKCSPVQYVSGDINSNALLGLTEVWKYTCSKTVSQTETNTATAHGWGVGLSMDVYDTASATVVVGLPVAPPLIHLVKTASPTVLPAVGGSVTYSYAVTNPGIVPLSDVSIADNKCTGLPTRVVGHLGDVNKNNLLDSTETWRFTCTSNITQTTTNIGTAEGHANGLTAIDFSQATVVVAIPGLPNAGLPPRDVSYWKVVLFAGIMVLMTASVAAIFKRRA